MVHTFSSLIFVFLNVNVNKITASVCAVTSIACIYNSNFCYRYCNYASTKTFVVVTISAAVAGIAESQHFVIITNEL